MFKKYLKRFQKDNKGVTLILAIVAVAFVGILAGAILSATSTNYKLKHMDKYSKNAFYSAESVTDEIYAGVGKMCFESLSKAYDTAASTLVFVNNNIVIQSNNDAANLKMKEEYKFNIGKSVFGPEMNLSDKDKIINYLNTFITNPTNAQVVSVGNVMSLATADSYGYKLGDVTIEYKTKSEDAYYSTVTVDVDMVYPKDLFVDFIAENNDLNSYFQYCIIGMDGVSIGKSTTEIATSSISGGLFAGTNGLKVNGKSQFILNDDIYKNGKEYIPTRVVSVGDINLSGESSGAKFFVNGAGEVWCNNINVGDEAGSAIVQYTNSEAKTHVADDLNLEGNNSNVLLAGKYFGFGNHTTYEDGVSDAAKSSAIVINGMNCTLNMDAINYLLIAGRGYVKLSDDQVYATGDSLALKGNQEIYLVPVGYIKKNNPSDTSIIASNPTEKPDDLYIDLSNFFAYKLGLLDGNGYVTRRVEGKTYYYLKFRGTNEQNEYVKCIIKDGYLESLYRNKFGRYATIPTAYTSEKDSIKLRVAEGLARFFSGGTEIKVPGGANVQTIGTLLEVTNVGGQSQMYVKEAADYVEATAAIASEKNKYSLIKTYLDLDASINYTEWPSKMVLNGGTQEIPSNRNDLSNIYELALDTEELAKLTENIVYTDAGTIAAVITSKDNTTQSSYTISSASGITGGVVVGYGVDIYVEGNFEGLIFTDKKVYTKGTGVITTGSNDRTETTLGVYDDVARFFRVFQPKSASNQLADIDISDLVKYSYWRKNEGA